MICANAYKHGWSRGTEHYYLWLFIIILDLQHKSPKHVWKNKFREFDLPLSCLVTAEIPNQFSEPQQPTTAFYISVKSEITRGKNLKGITHI